jgi:RNA polymerase sigma factor (sigma-70 family)
MSGDHDYILIDKILRGDMFASRTLVERHKSYAFTLAYRILNNRDDAEDATQEAFIKVFKSLPNFQRDAKFTTWLYKIVVNSAISLQRSRKTNITDIDSAQDVILRDKDRSMDQLDQRAYIDKAMQYMIPDDAAVITLFYLKESSIEEISQIMELEINTIKVELHRARKRMADIMKSMLKEETQNLY